MRFTVLVAMCALAVAAFGQERRGEPKPQTKPARVPGAILDRYDFEAQLQALQGAGPLTPLPAIPSVAAGPEPLVQKTARPKPDVPLTPTAEEAVRMSEKWMASKNTPAAGADGKVLYSYGAGLPTVVCAPLRVCIIELQLGEKVIGEPQIGDSVRWNLAPAMYGKGDEVTSMIVLKPQMAGLDTNLLITTDRRAYYFRLISKPEDYVARVAFAYPDDDQRKWQVHIAQQREQEKLASRARDVPPAAIVVEKICFDYSITGGDATLRPVRVFDDGAKTYIQMPPGVKHRDAPALVVAGPDGKGEMVNYRIKDQMYIVDRLFKRAQLVLGAGKKAKKVEISRERES